MSRLALRRDAARGSATGDRAAARSELAATEREPDPVLRARPLVEALIWLDAVLNADMPMFPDPPPR